MHYSLAARRTRRGSQDRGSALVEFVLCCGLFLVPLLLGTGAIGFSLVRAVKVTQVCRDAAHMYAYGTDFAQTGSKDLIVSLAQGLGMTSTSGNGVIIFSTIIRVDDAACQAGGLQSGGCTNLNHSVFTRRLYVGNQKLHPSNFGTPDSVVDQTTGSISISNYLKSSAARADAFQGLIPLASGQSAYLSEMWAVAPGDDFWGSFALPQPSARFIF